MHNTFLSPQTIVVGLYFPHVTHPSFHFIDCVTCVMFMQSISLLTRNQSYSGKVGSCSFLDSIVLCCAVEALRFETGEGKEVAKSSS